MRRHDIRTGGIYYGTADYKTDINWRNASDGYGNCSNLNGSSAFLLPLRLLQMDMGIAAILMAAGMHCVGCPSSAMESLEEACMVHGMDADQVLKRVNDYLANKDK